ncbi:hypothetical protein DFJ58DRAFT_821492 [Suillus subalutaceus]|uniref:uncharacterized protein n=1 Tax=Suillus subalutaceus TaxID=48586 RepID=UPI001B8620EC|nr:uncharacterized protein DFJ58DRAFT_821492 [Suillus subalutaceus]KAG1834329.1 hypothetical protein DFJ58DRAFT_821492 [Suillus subalutaceus]
MPQSNRLLWPSTAKAVDTSTRKPFGRVNQHTGSDHSSLLAGTVINSCPLSIERSRKLDSLSGSSTSASDELPDGTGFSSELVGSRDYATSPFPSLPPQGHSNHEIPSLVRASPPVELPDRIQVPPEIANSRDSAASPSPSFLPRGSPHPQIAAASASTPVFASPPKSLWKHFSIFNRSAASVDSKRWKFPRIGSIMQRKHRNTGPDDPQH